MATPLGDRIRDRRQRKGWTLKDLAAATGLSVPYLSDLERKPVNPSLETVTVLAGALGCTVAELLGEGSAADAPLMHASLAAFSRSHAFAARIAKLAENQRMRPDETRTAVLNFMAAAPKRASGELTEDDWRRLLDVYELITAE